MTGPIFAPTPEAVERSQLTAFTRFCEARTGANFADYAALHRFSVSDRAFWSLFLEWSGLVVEGEREPVCTDEAVERAVFFPRLRVSYVQNLLAGDPTRLALIGADETGRRIRVTRGELTRRVLGLAASLQGLGIGPDTRVVAVASNTVESVVACLACAALGASWSATSPDIGLHAMLDRFRQLEPGLLFCQRTYHHHGAVREIGDRVDELVRALPSLRAVVALDDAPTDVPAPVRGATLGQLIETAAKPLRLEELPRFAWNHPLFILFSSGTTGAPKCIVHGAGGTLLEHVKEHRLHGDLGPEDTLYFQTGCGWMMWNWQLSALAAGAAIVLYDGSVSFPEDDALWRLAAAERVTVLGTSPAYLQYCRDAGIVPRERADLATLRAIQSTGSVLADAHYVWVKENVKEVPLQSVSGGTDIVGCFLLGNPNLPVYAGEMQCVGLGLDVRAIQTLPGGATSVGPHDGVGASGELICASPFPSRPIGLFGDPDGARFHDAYFGQNEGVWTHGDLLELTPRGTARIHGRSDGVLNIRGIRIGPAEIYAALRDFDQIAEAMAVEQAAPAEPGGSRLVLLLVLRPGVVLDRPLTLKIKKELSQRCSMAHVPAVVAQVDELPTTHNGKKSERAARDALNGGPIANLGALKNPDAVRALAERPDLRV